MNRYSFAIAALLASWAVLSVVGQVGELPLPQALPPSLPGEPQAPQPFAPASSADVPSRAMPVPGIPSKPSGAPLSSTSATGQFIVYGPDLRVRSGIAGKCEEISQELGRLLRTPDPWVLTIVIQIKPLTPADPPDLGITTQVSALTHGGFHLQMNVPERAGLRPADFRRELIRLLLTERILRSHKRLANEQRDQLLPAWIQTGVLKALDYRLRGRPSAEFAAIFKSGKVYGIEEILEAQPAGLDGLSRTIYETSCCALMLAVIEQPEGPLRFSRFLAALAQEDKPQRELLKQWFPGLAESEVSLNKWWSLQLAALASPNLAETLDPTQTAELLDRALTFRVPAVEGQKLPEPTVVASIASQRPAALPVPVIAASATPNAALQAPKSTPESTPKASASKSSKGGAKTVSSRPKDIPTAPVVVDAGTAEDSENEQEKQKRGFLRNFLPFGRGSADKMEDAASESGEDPPDATVAEEKVAKDEAAATKAREKELKRAEEKEAKEKAAQERAEKEKAKKEQEAQAKAEKEQAAMAAAEAKKASQAEPEAAPEKAAKEKPKAAEPAPAEGNPRAPSLNPLKWFRGGSKDKSEGKDSEKTPSDEAAVLDFGASVEMAWQPASVREARVVRDLLGNAHGRYIQAPAKTEPGVDPLPLPPVAEETADRLALPAPQPVPTAAPSGVPFPIEDYAVILAHPQKEPLLAQARLALQSLGIRGNALFREIAAEYQKVIADLSAGKTKDMDTRLKTLRKRAVDTYVQACAVQDHLDWFEATQSTRYSGLFEDFLTLPERVREELPPRNDPISKYLDEVEAQRGR